MADEPHLRNRQYADGDTARAEAYPDATETTALLGSETSSQTLRDGSPAGSRRGRGSDEDSDAATQHIGATKAAVLMFSTWILIFLQGQPNPSPSPGKGFSL